MGKRRDGIPVWVSEESSLPLTRVDLRNSAAGCYDEAWLQRLLHRHPATLPIGQIEPSFGRVRSACRELSLAFGAGKTGALDNVLLTETGGLVLVETKLWRNPEARRSVVAQAMEYAAAVFRLSYEELEVAVQISRRSASEEPLTLYQIAGSHGELDEAAFVDAVTRNLRRGRAIVAVVGDGIREDILPLAELLQAHAGLRFTFVLIELGVYSTPDGSKLVVPSVLAETTLIERGVVSIREPAHSAGQIIVDPPETAPQGPIGRPGRAITIGEDEFYELLDQREPGLSVLLQAFLKKTDELGIFVDRQSGLNLKHTSTSGPPLNLATIRKDGYVDTGPSTWWGRTKVGHRYNQTLAKATGGFVKDMMLGEQSALRTRTGKTPRLSDLIPEHGDSWLDAMREYILEMTDSVPAGS